MSVAKQRDGLLIGALAVFGLLVVGSAYAMSGLVRDQLLADDATAFGTRWGREAAPVVAASQSENDLAAAAFALIEPARRDGLTEVTVVRTDGRVLVEKRIGGDGGLRPGRQETAIDQELLASVLSGRIHVERAHAVDGDGMLLTITAPVEAEGGIAGFVRVAVDQSRLSRLLSEGMGLIAAGTAAVAWLAFFIPTFIGWRRMKERTSAEERMHHIAHHDALTDLPNRLLFNDRLERALVRAQRGRTRVAVLCIDLDRFKEINDTLGHPVGDLLLIEVARRLRDTVRDVDTVGRLGGDEFAIVAEEVQKPENVITLARRLTEALSRPFELDGHVVQAGGSVGVAMTPEDGLTAVALMKNADLALYRAKSDGRGGFRFFEPDMDADLQRRRMLETDMRRAIVERQFVLHYQAQYDAETGRLTGYEALVRWPHPERGVIAPSDFIPVAEESGLIVPLGEWILETACREALGWDEGVRIAVNVSPAQFKKNDIAGTVARVLAETGLPSERLEIEITEAVLLQNSDYVIGQLSKLRALGVALAMDDFGTGYSSLSYLARFPFDKLKIDGSFVQQMDQDPKLAAIVHTIVGLGNRLDMKITAEGVETTEQREALRRFGNVELQGFLFGRPTAIPRQGDAPAGATSPVAPVAPVAPDAPRPVEAAPVAQVA